MYPKLCNFERPNVAHRRTSDVQNLFRVDFRVRQTHFQDYFENLVKKVPNDHFHCMGNPKGFQRPQKSLWISRTVKMVVWNFFDQIFKIMLKMCFSDPKVHPEKILNTWSSSVSTFGRSKLHNFGYNFRFPPSIEHLRKLSVF